MSPDQIEEGRCYLAKANGRAVVVKVLEIAGVETKTTIVPGNPSAAPLEKVSHKARSVRWISRAVVPPGGKWSQPRVTTMRDFVRSVEREVDCG
jgi:hypothetical protein